MVGKQVLLYVCPNPSEDWGCGRTTGKRGFHYAPGFEMKGGVRIPRSPRTVSVYDPSRHHTLQLRIKVMSQRLLVVRVLEDRCQRHTTTKTAHKSDWHPYRTHPTPPHHRDIFPEIRFHSFLPTNKIQKIIFYFSLILLFYLEGARSLVTGMCLGVSRVQNNNLFAMYQSIGEVYIIKIW